MSDLKVSKIKPVFKCPSEFKARFSESTCLLTISVGQEVHEDEKFQVTIDLINNTFNKIVILVDDSLQRHSMSLLTPQTGEELYELSVLEGDRWLERNLETYSKLNTPYEIIRWDKWLKHAEYESIHDRINWHYNNKPDIKEKFDSTVIEFLDRFVRRTPLDPTKSYEQAFEICLTYLKEECTALCLWVEGQYHFEVYPSKRNLAMQTTHEMFVIPNHPDLLHPVAIKFKNRKQLKPQIFSTHTHPAQGLSQKEDEKECINVG